MFRILIVIVLVVLVVVPAAAEDIYTINAEVVSCEATSFGRFEVEALTEEGDVFAYFEDEEVSIGEPVSLTLFNVEVIDVIYFNKINMIQEVSTC